MKLTYTADEMSSILSKLESIEATAKHRAEHYKNIPPISADFQVAEISAVGLREILQGEWEWRIGGEDGRYAWFQPQQKPSPEDILQFEADLSLTAILIGQIDGSIVSYDAAARILTTQNSKYLLITPKG